MHSVRVAETARQLAKDHLMSTAEPYLAGLLHDIAKSASPTHTYAYDIDFTQDEMMLYESYPQVWHAFVGPKFVHALYGNISKAVENAIRWHTTGTAKMCDLTQIIYIADFIEPHRFLPNLDYIRALSRENLDAATVAIVISTIYNLKLKSKQIHPETLNCYEWYVNKIGKNATNNIFVSLKVPTDFNI
jgi:predicted HD superfamily hydrolase involved in NAD metabolism